MLRSALVLFAIPAGLAAGTLAWLAAGGASASATKLEPVERALSVSHMPAPGLAILPAADVTELANLPLLLLTTGPGAVPQPTLRLDGLVRSRSRKAALLSVNDQPALWFAQGEGRDGVSLREVAADRVVVDTAYGPQEVALGAHVGPPAAPLPGPAALPPASVLTPGPAADKIPPGFRSPPPPASAPRPH